MNDTPKRRGRPRLDLGPNADQRIAELGAQGYTTEAIADKLRAEGFKVTSRTISRRRRELGIERHHVKPKPPPSQPAQVADEKPLPETAADVPDDADPVTLDGWIKRAHAQSVAAERSGNLDLFGKLARISTALLEAKRKATPKPVPSPNDNPDMVKLAAEVAARLHKMIDQVVT